MTDNVLTAFGVGFVVGAFAVAIPVGLLVERGDTGHVATLCRFYYGDALTLAGSVVVAVEHEMCRDGLLGEKE